MTNVPSLAVEVYVGLRESDGKWLAATNASPYFCFECGSREEALAAAKSALQLYSDNLHVIEDVIAARERDAVVPSFTKVSKELLSA